MNKQVSLEYLDDYNIDELKVAVEKGFENLNLRGFFKPKMNVLLKVCLPNDSSQDMAESTHPNVVRVFVDYLSKYEVNCIVADSPYGKHSLSYLDSVYLNSGMLEMANLTNCELNRDLSTTKIEIANGIMTKGVQILSVLNKVDAIINIGKLKIDDELGYLGASANIFGIIPADMKTLILNRISCLGDFNNYIIDLIEKLKEKVVLNVLDAVVSLEANKTQRMLNCLAMSECPYSIDGCMVEVLGLKKENTILKQASDRGLFDLNKTNKTIGEKCERFVVEDFSMNEFDNHTEIKHKKNYFKSHQQRVVIDKKVCKGCKICSQICPTNAILMKCDNQGELYAEIDYKKCIFCKKCLTGCPYSVVKLKTPLAYKNMKKRLKKYNAKERE